MSGSDAVVDNAAAAAEIIAALTRSRTTIAVAESLTGGLLCSALVDVPGASAVLRGGVVAYDTAVKHSVLGVDAEVLAAHGPVHPDVAMQMAVGVRSALAVEGVPAEIGISTTGAAGPDPQDGAAPGTVYVGVAIGADVRSHALELEGDRAAIRAETVRVALRILRDSL
ncbi:CinA family protein [Herbiconiux sp. KACC 21604]|uniref:CinA family protein n=1 Tax=unclassified Herbiconiux TaxID=2618217 RepID=UPI001490D0C0|nr:CinA family protein [Herbiconiux sp. SALV-R1]QJU53033.1 CinA family protein [Herbiconiux sp. SALV-R1]WPO87968.1 CinA family protein [Herbiconiux sp. KACC 21604]